MLKIKEVMAKCLGVLVGTISMVAFNFCLDIAQAVDYPSTTTNPLTVDLGFNGRKLSDIGDVITYSPWLDARWYANLKQAVVDIGSTNETTLLIPHSFNINDGTAETVTVTSNITLQFIKAGKLVKVGSGTVAINGPFQAPEKQVFSGFNAGDVTFGVGSVDAVNVKWMGPTGTADDTTTFNIALRAHKKVYVPGRVNDTYLVDGVIVRTNELFGTGATLKLKNSAVDHILVLDSNADGVSIHGLYFDGNSANNPSSRAISTGSGGKTIENIDIYENTFKNVSDIGISLTGPDWTNHCTRIKIYDNKFMTCIVGVKLQFCLTSMISRNIFHNTTAPSDAIYINTSAQDNLIEENSFYGTSAGGGIFCAGSFSTINDNMMRTGKYGVKIYDNENTIISNNKLTGDFAENVIHLTGTATGNKYITISGNNLYGMTPGTPANGAGIVVDGNAHDIAITGNTVMEVANGIAIIPTLSQNYGFSITGNTITNCDSEGITTQGQVIDNLVIVGNLVRSTGLSGIRATGGPAIMTISHNVIQDANTTNTNGHTGIKISPNLCIRSRFEGNVLYGITHPDLPEFSNPFHTFTNGDTTPSVQYGDGTHFKTNNSSITTITTFDNGLPGQEILIVFGDAKTTITETGNIKLSGTSFSSTINDTMRLIYDGTWWYEISRSAN